MASEIKNPRYSIGDSVMNLPRSETKTGSQTILQKNSHWIKLMVDKLGEWTILEISSVKDLSKYKSRVTTLNKRHRNDNMSFETRQLDNLLYFFGKIEDKTADDERIS
tara:strand:+ start:102 stop:425 length:324 start_codon:yes stop_codon:yes gene_type:complete